MIFYGVSLLRAQFKLRALLCVSLFTHTGAINSRCYQRCGHSKTQQRIISTQGRPAYRLFSHTLREGVGGRRRRTGTGTGAWVVVNLNVSVPARTGPVAVTRATGPVREFTPTLLATGFSFGYSFVPHTWNLTSVEMFTYCTRSPGRWSASSSFNTLHHGFHWIQISFAPRFGAHWTMSPTHQWCAVAVQPRTVCLNV